MNRRGFAGATLAGVGGFLFSQKSYGGSKHIPSELPFWHTVDKEWVFFTALSAVEKDASTGRKCEIKCKNKTYLVVEDSLASRAILDSIHQWEKATLLPAYLAKGHWKISRGGLPVIGILVRYQENN